MFKVGSIVKYVTPYKPQGDWGMIVSILELKDSLSTMKGIIYYRVQPLHDVGMASSDIVDSDILECYERTFKLSKGKKKSGSNN